MTDPNTIRRDVTQRVERVLDHHRGRRVEAERHLASATDEVATAKQMLGRQPGLEHARDRFAQAETAQRTAEVAREVVDAEVSRVEAELTGAEAEALIAELVDHRVALADFDESLADIADDAAGAAERLAAALARFDEARTDHYERTRAEGAVAGRLRIDAVRSFYSADRAFAGAALVGVEAAGTDVWRFLDAVRGMADALRMRSADRQADAMRGGDESKSKALDRIDKQRGELRAEGRLGWG